MSAGVVTAHLDDVRTISFGSEDEPDWKPLRHELGIGAFGVNAWLAPATGDQAIERHDEKVADGGTNGHEELYVISVAPPASRLPTSRSTRPRARSCSWPIPR